MSRDIVAHLDNFVETASVDPEMLNEFEKALLVYAMNNAGYARQLTKMLQPEEFSNPEHQKVFAVIQKVIEETTPKNYGLVTFAIEFQEKGLSVDIEEFYPYAGTIKSDNEANQIAFKLHDIFLKKDLQNNLSSLIVGLSGMSSSEAIERLKLIESEVGSRLLGADSGKSLDDALDGFEEFLLSPERPTIYRIGVPEIDRNIVDFTKNNLTVIGARPSTGKTALMVRSAYENAKDGVPVHVFSLEMSEHQLSARFFSITSRIPPRILLSKQNPLSPSVIAAHRKALRNLPLQLSMPSSITISSLIAEMRESAVKYGTQVFYVDYLQLVRASVGKGRYDEVSFVSQELTSIAKELGVSVVALSQLRRPQNKSLNNEPSMEELKESGDIEQDASLIFLMYKPKEPVIMHNDHMEIRIKIEKQRNGPSGQSFKIGFDPTKTFFYEIVTKEEGEAK